MKKVIILGAGVYQVPLIKKAKSMGVYTIVVSYKGNYPGFKYADKVYYEDTTDIEKVLEIAKSEKIDGIVTTGTDVPVVTIGKVADELGLNGVSFKAAELATNKLKMKKAFINGDVRTAKFNNVYNLEEAIEAFNTLEKPVIFKAVDSSGSRGIIRVDSIEEVERAYDEVEKVTKLDYFIVEEFIEGIEFGAQALVHKGKLKFILPHGDILFVGNTGVPIGHYAPYELGNKVNEDTELQTINCIKALGLDNCAINADFILKDDKVYVLEIGARAGATCLPELVSIYYNIDYYEMLIKCALGEDIKFKSNFKVPNASILLTSDKDGKIKEVINNNCEDDDIIDISMDYKINDEVRKFAVGPDRIGQIIVKEDSLEKAMEKLEEVKNKVKIIVK